MTETILPYGGDSHPNSGHAGSETSRARAETADADGTTRARQRAVIDAALAAGPDGVTVVDLRYRTGWHHGTASGALSQLHNGGRLVRLSEVRDRCKVYVLPEYVQGREAEPQGQTATTVLLGEAVELLRDWVDAQDVCPRPGMDYDAAQEVIARYDARK